MTEKNSFDDVVREQKPRKGPDPNDAFSQKAAENKKPRNGMGLTDAPGERSEHDKSDLQDAPTGEPSEDAQGQSESRRKGGTNDGASDNPRVLSSNDDGHATFSFKSKQD